MQAEYGNTITDIGILSVLRAVPAQSQRKAKAQNEIKLPACVKDNK